MNYSECAKTRANGAKLATSELVCDSIRVTYDFTENCASEDVCQGTTSVVPISLLFTS
jgi:hypothetical protein